MKKRVTFDNLFLGILITISLIGFFIFISASMGLLVDGWENFQRVIVKQILVGIILGWGGLYISYKIYYKNWERISPYIFITSIVLTLAVFIPGIGFGSGGARSWIDIGFTTVQPSEFLKFGFVVYYASFLVSQKERVRTLKYGLLPTLLILGLPAIILLKQPDTGTLISITASCLVMFLVAGGKKRHFLLLIILGIITVATMAYFKPYAMARIMTFLDPTKDPLGAGYQIRQSLIAIGSGQIIGRGFGQSIQKFKFLPEAVGDSVFAVLSEEFGFMGSVTLVSLFMFFGLRGLKISSQAKDDYGRLLSLGLITLVISQSFVNMGAMLSILPLTGLPLIFLSHGGTALVVSLFEMGIILNISKYQKK